MSRLRIGLDIDSVIADTLTSWAAYIKSQDGICHAATDGFDYDAKPSGWDYWMNVCPTCFDHVLHDRERIMELKLNPGAIFAICELAREVDLYILTSRPADVHHHTIAWLEKMGVYKWVQMVMFSHDKAEDAALLQLDYHVEDAPHHIAAIRQRGDTIPLIFNQPYNKDEEGLRFFNWDEVKHFLLAAATDHFYMDRSYAEA